MPKFKAKRYCIASNCRNCDRNWTQFFTLPRKEEDFERCRKWLTLLGREDLIDKINSRKKTTYNVCSAHFDSSSIKIIKQLKKDALPTMLLANEQTPISAHMKDKGEEFVERDKMVKIEKTEISPSTSAQNKDKGEVFVQPNKRVKRVKIDIPSTSHQTNDKCEVFVKSDKMVKTEKKEIRSTSAQIMDKGEVIVEPDKMVKRIKTEIPSTLEENTDKGEVQAVLFRGKQF